jgi:O-antigen ligase
MIAVQSIVGSLQFLTSSTVGFPAKYFGSGGSASLLENKDAVRVIGTLDSTPTVLGRAISIFLPFVAIYPPGSSPRFRQRIYRVIALIAGVVVILMTQSRSAALVVGGMGGLWLLRRSIANLRRAARLRVTWEGLYFSYFFVVAFGGGVVAMQQVGGISYIEQAITSTVYRFETIAILGTRFELMRGAVILFQEQPILGNGYLSTMYLAEQTDILVPAWRSFLRVHNAYLQFLAEGGLIGFLSYSYFTTYPIYRLWKSNVRSKKIYYSFLISVLMIIVFSQSSTAYDRYSLAPLYMMILGGAMGFVDVSKSRSVREPMCEK